MKQEILTIGRQTISILSKITIKANLPSNLFTQNLGFNT